MYEYAASERWFAPGNAVLFSRSRGNASAATCTRYASARLQLECCVERRILTFETQLTT